MTSSATSIKSKVTFLETVYPPISNQEAVWLQNDPEVEALLRQSDFYMIGGRAEAKYLNLVIDPETYENGGGIVGHGSGGIGPLRAA